MENKEFDKKMEERTKSFHACCRLEILRDLKRAESQQSEPVLNEATE